MLARRKPRRFIGDGEALVGLSQESVLVDIRVGVCHTLDMDYQRDEHRVHLIVYHLIWRLKRRKAVLGGLVATRCKASIEGKCTERGWIIPALAIQPDHLHLFVRVWPSDSAAEVVKECKGITSFHLRRAFPHLLILPSICPRCGRGAT